MSEIIITQTISPKNYCKYEHTMCEFANDRGYCVKTGCSKRIIINEKPCANKNLVEVVRCKDCKYYPDGKQATMWTPCREDIRLDGKWYCAYGERREEDAAD